MPQNPFDLNVALAQLKANQQQPQPPQQTNPYDLNAALQGLRGPDTRGLPQLPPGPSNADRPIGKEPLGDLVDLFGGLLGIQNPISPDASRMTQIAGGVGAALPLLPGMFSRLQQAISGVPSKMIHANKAMQLAQQVPEEARATGLIDWLKARGNSQLPTSDLVEYSQSNPLNLIENVGGEAVRKPDLQFKQFVGADNNPYWVAPEGYKIEHIPPELRSNIDDPAFYVHGPSYGLGQYHTPEDAFDAANAARRSLDKSPTFYNQYTLPGGTNYTERNVSWQPSGPVQHDMQGNVIAPYNDKTFSSHPSFDPGNMLAWSRASEHNSPSGPMKLIEEIQSDWHQKGNTQGYQDPEKLAALVQQQRQQEGVAVQKWDAIKQQILNDPNFELLDDKDYGVGDVYNHPEDFAHSLSPDVVNAVINFRKEYESPTRYAIQDQIQKLKQATPWAPFTDKWPDLMLKRELYDAAQNDMSGIAWTPGAVQNQRWSLSQVADQLRYVPPDAGNRYRTAGELTAYKNGQQLNSYDINDPAELANYVGQGAAAHLMANPMKIVDTGNMEVGGQGMRQFYDQSIPNKMQKLVSPFGGKVEPVGAVVPGTQPGFFGPHSPTMDDLKRYPDRYPNVTSIMGVKLTPEMKKLILQRGFYALSPLMAAILGEQGQQEQR